MNRLKYYFFLPASIVLILISCSKGSTTNAADTSGNWVKRSEFDGNARTEAVSFTIGDTAYLGTGFDGTNRYNDFWAYDPEKNYWIQKAQFPGIARNSAVGFSVGTKGYIATGYDGLNKLNDTWEYNQATNSWTQKANFAGTPRYDAVAFGINSKGYLTTGFDGGYTKDMWEFDPAAGSNGTWTQKVSLGGSKRSGAVAFVYNNKGYVVTGFNNGQAVSDFWVFDPSASGGSWTQLRDITNSNTTETYDDDYTDIVRTQAVAFIIGTKAYLAVGENGTPVVKTWEYDFASDTWARKTTYERADRSGAVGFTVKGRGFVACGKNSTYYLDDIDEFHPDETENSLD
ncbi:MAG TPA: kelch repeat-containing protein [Sediminibacterium sp.]|nr:kelch repeat-containing protein [Sediminibacterium sp.]